MRLNSKVLFMIILLAGILIIIPINATLGTEKESEGIVKIEIKHHKPEDLMIKIGYSEVGVDFRPSSAIKNPSESCWLHVFREDEITNNFIWEKNLREIEFDNIRPPNKHETIWFTNIEDTGSIFINPKHNLTENELEKTNNWLVRFSITFNGIIYTSLEHPYFDDGGEVQARIFGLDGEITSNIGTLGIPQHGGAAGIIGVSKYAFYDPFPEQAYDAWYFYDVLIELMYWGRIGTYDMYLAIDGDSDPDFPNHSPTHTAIYTTTIDSILNSVDSSTENDDTAIIYMTSHAYLYFGSIYFMTYDTWWWGRYYTPTDYGTKLRGLTDEGTSVFSWLSFCKSDTWSWWFGWELIHNNLHLYWTYDHGSLAEDRYYSIPEFRDRCIWYTEPLEDSFFYVDYVYYQHFQKHMTQRDNHAGTLQITIPAS